ncbi:hypothetical protein TNCV_944351 [Trichonephila clavipes]|nr:hypothetical protein TNCV_944351 [Trichonephila clavipes]
MAPTLARSQPILGENPGRSAHAHHSQRAADASPLPSLPRNRRSAYLLPRDDSDCLPVPLHFHRPFLICRGAVSTDLASHLIPLKRRKALLERWSFTDRVALGWPLAGVTARRIAMCPARSHALAQEQVALLLN